MAEGALIRSVSLGLLLVFSGCLEGFGTLETTVNYDPFLQVFRVERRLVNVDARFFGCEEIEGCAARVQAALSFEPVDTMTTPAQILGRRLVESGATELVATLVSVGEQVDVIVRYTAPVASQAAEDTLVHAEYRSRSGGHGGFYYLVVDGEASAEPPEGRWSLRKVGQGGPSGVDWRDQWVLTKRETEVFTRLVVDEVEHPLLGAVGVRDALAASGLIVIPVEAPIAEAPVSETIPVAVLRRGRPDRERAAAPPVFLHDPRVRGNMDVEILGASFADVFPKIESCFAARAAERPDLKGFVFLFARVSAGGVVAGTSVYGTVSDPQMFACAEAAFAHWVAPSGDSYEVEFPINFRGAAADSRTDPR